MSDIAEAPARSVKHSLPLALCLAFSGLFFLYLVLPGFLIGFLVRSGICAPVPEHVGRWEVMKTIFFVPIFLGEHIKPMGQFYEWQINLVDGVDTEF